MNDKDMMYSIELSISRFLDESLIRESDRLSEAYWAVNDRLVINKKLIDMLDRVKRVIDNGENNELWAETLINEIDGVLEDQPNDET